MSFKYANNNDRLPDGISAVIFDMDGLMFDSESLSRDEWEKVARNNGISIPGHIINQTLGLTCSDIKSLIQKHFDEEGIAVDAAALYRERNVLLLESIERDGVPAKPGLYELIAHIQKKRFRMAVASSASPQKVEALLRKSDLLDVFDAILHGGDVKNGKPAPDIFLATAKRLELLPGECLVLEDSANGVVAANAAGMPVIMVPDQIAPTDEIRGLAFKVLSSLNEVISLI